MIIPSYHISLPLISRCLPRQQLVNPVRTSFAPDLHQKEKKWKGRRRKITLLCAGVSEQILFSFICSFFFLSERCLLIGWIAWMDTSLKLLRTVVQKRFIFIIYLPKTWTIKMQCGRVVWGKRKRKHFMTLHENVVCGVVALSVYYKSQHVCAECLCGGSINPLISSLANVAHLISHSIKFIKYHQRHFFSHLMAR